MCFSRFETTEEHKSPHDSLSRRRAADRPHRQQRDPRQHEPRPEGALLHAGTSCRAESSCSVSTRQPGPRGQPGMLLSCPGGYPHAHDLQPGLMTRSVLFEWFSLVLDVRRCMSTCFSFLSSPPCWTFAGRKVPLLSFIRLDQRPASTLPRRVTGCRMSSCFLVPYCSSSFYECR